MTSTSACRGCGGPVPQAPYRPRIYCSLPCRNRDYRTRYPRSLYADDRCPRARLRKPDPICPACGMEFRRRGPRDVYCSSPCKPPRRRFRCSLAGCDGFGDHRGLCDTHRMRFRKYGSYDVPPKPERAPKPERVVACIQCGQVFRPIGRQRLCGGDCRDRWRRSKNREYNVSRRKRPPNVPRIPGRCRRCGIDFLGQRGIAQLYCSRSCRRRQEKDRRAMRKRAVYIEEVWRSRVYERDGWRCQLCGKAVRRDVKAPHPRAPTLDHIIPLAAGGRHEYANIQLAHFFCNSVKGVGDGQLNLALIGV